MSQFEDDDMNRIDNKIDKLQDSISSIDVTLASQHEILKDHTRRSLANEEAVSILTEKLQPVITHVAIMQLLGKVLLGIAGSEITWYIIKKVFIDV